MARPTKLPRWATGGTAVIVEPSEPEKDAGHLPQTILTAQLANWLANLAYQWITYLDTDRPALTTATAPAQVTATTVATIGTDVGAAHADHVHALPTAAPAALTIGGTVVTGTSASLARADHVHAMPAAAAAATLTPNQSAGTGAAATFARSDHAHGVVVASPANLNVGSATSVGASNSFNRADHVHQMPGLATTSADGFLSANDKLILSRLPRVNQCRISGESASAIMTADNAAISTIYLLPYVGSSISLYVSALSMWIPFDIASAGLSLALSGMTTGRPYDVYCNAPSTIGGTPALELWPWTSTTARVAALALQDGVWVRSGTPTARYLGTIFARSATTISWVQNGNDVTSAKCDIWNADNRELTPFRYTRSWTPETFTHPTANTWVAANGTSSRVELVQGQLGPWTRADVLAAVQPKTFAAVTAVGLDTVSTPTGLRPRTLITQTADATETNGQASLQVPIGSHYLAWLIWASSTTVVWWGAQSVHESGLICEFSC